MTTPTTTQIREAEAFDDWPQAFDACRERNRPLTVMVGGEVAKIFPSGHCKTIEVRAELDRIFAGEVTA